MPDRVPEVTFHSRGRKEALGGDNPFEWSDLTTRDVSGSRRVVLFALPGAFTPACSDSHPPGVPVSVSDAATMLAYLRIEHGERREITPAPH